MSSQSSHRVVTHESVLDVSAPSRTFDQRETFRGRSRRQVATRGADQPADDGSRSPNWHGAAAA